MYYHLNGQEGASGMARKAKIRIHVCRPRYIAVFGSSVFTLLARKLVRRFFAPDVQRFHSSMDLDDFHNIVLMRICTRKHQIGVQRFQKFPEEVVGFRILTFNS